MRSNTTARRSIMNTTRTVQSEFEPPRRQTAHQQSGAQVGRLRTCCCLAQQSVTKSRYHFTHTAGFPIMVASEGQIPNEDINLKGAFHMRSTRTLPFKPGDAAYVSVADYPGRRFSVLVKDIQPEHFVTNLPMVEGTGEAIEIVPGQHWNFTTYHPQFGICRFTSRVIKVTPGAASEVLLELPTHLQRIQRRKLVRMPVSLPVSLVNVKNREVALQAQTKDLSGGGMAIVSEKRVSPGTLWEVRLVLPDDAVIAAQARCVKSMRIGRDDEDKWLCGFEFLNLQPADQDTLVRLVITEERKRLREKQLDQ